jgi:hypothetical protein
MGVLYVPLISCKIFINATKISGGIMKKYKYKNLDETSKVRAREFIDRNGGDIREISKEQYEKWWNKYNKNVWQENHTYFEERFAATSDDWEVIDLCEQNEWYFEKDGTKIKGE